MLLNLLPQAAFVTLHVAATDDNINSWAHPTAPSVTRRSLRDPGWQAQSASHTSRRTPIAERFWVPNLDLRCRRWHPAKTPGVLRIASSVLHILPQTADAPYFKAPRKPS
jgi:hypothetical protein